MPCFFLRRLRQPVVLARAMVVCALSLSGCATDNVVKTWRLAFPSADQVEETKLMPGVRYLRVTANGRTSLLVLGYAESKEEGLEETWYSGKGEVLNLRQGHLVNTAGLSLDWRNVGYSHLKQWPQLISRIASGSSLPGIRFSRAHDEMPGYRMNIQDEMVAGSIPPPRDSGLRGLDPAALQWIEERPADNRSQGFVSRYGVYVSEKQTRVIYGEQCLAADFCLAWQEWPVVTGMQR